MANDRNFDGELTKAISGSLIVGRVVVMAVAITIASLAVYAFNALAIIKVDRPKLQWLFWVNYTISGIGWVLAAYFVLAGMASVCKMAVARESGESSNVLRGIIGIGANLFVVVFATLRYLIWFAALLLLIWGLGFLGRIPGFGPIIYGIGLGLVSTVAALWLAVHIGKFFVSALVLPGIIATAGQKGMSCYKEAKRLLNGQPVRLVKRFLAVGLVLVLFSFLVAQGLTLLAGDGRTTAGHAGNALGRNSYEVLIGGPPLKKLPMLPVYPALPLGQRMRMGTAIPRAQAEGARLAGAWIYGIELIVVLLILKAIAANFFALAGLATYNSLKGEKELPIKAPDVKVDLSKIKGSFDAVGAKIKEEMKGETAAPKKKKAEEKEEGD